MAVKLLLADESFTVRKVVQIIYRSTDTQVSVVTNSEELFSGFKSLEPDLILLSATFPEINIKRDIKTFIRSDNLPVPVVILAERSSAVDSKKSKKLGASGFLFKPLDNRDLKKTVDELLKEEAEPPAIEAETTISPAVKAPEADMPVEKPAAASGEVLIVPPVPAMTTASPEQRARVLMEIMESYLNENVVLISDSLAKQLAPKIAPEVAGKIMESIDFTNLPYKVATIIDSVIQDLVPQLAEELISREIDNIKEEAARILATEDGE